MPPTTEQLRRAATSLGMLRLVRFEAGDTTLFAGASTSLRWEVDKSQCPHPNLVSVVINNSSVASSGQMSVRPGRTMTYSLVARAVGLHRTLRQVTITVDQSTCEVHEISEEEVVLIAAAAIERRVEERNADPDTDNKAWLSRDPVIQIEPQGIVISMKLELQIDNFTNPDVYVDAVIAVGVSSSGEGLAWYKSFSVDVDWPWWVTGLSHGISKIVEEFVDEAVQSELKPIVLEAMKSNLNAAISSYGGVVSGIETARDRILVTACSIPEDDGGPFDGGAAEVGRGLPTA